MLYSLLFQVYRVYRGRLHYEGQTTLSRQISIIRTRFSSIERNSELSAQQNRHMRSDGAAVQSNINGSKLKIKMVNGSQQNTEKRVSFMLDTNLTIHEQDENDSEDSIQD